MLPTSDSWSTTRQPFAHCVLTPGFKSFNVPKTYVFCYTSQGQYTCCVNHNKIEGASA